MRANNKFWSWSLAQAGTVFASSALLFLMALANFASAEEEAKTETPPNPAVLLEMFKNATRLEITSSDGMQLLRATVNDKETIARWRKMIVFDSEIHRVEGASSALEYFFMEVYQDKVRVGTFPVIAGETVRYGVKSEWAVSLKNQDLVNAVGEYMREKGTVYKEPLPPPKRPRKSNRAESGK